MSGLHLYDIDQDEEQRTIVVASALPGDGSNGVFGVVDPTYLIGRLLDIEDTNVDKVTAQLNGKKPIRLIANFIPLRFTTLSSLSIFDFFRC
ncbi:hypothetical protein QW180_00845 [Vibrio sinaloensis]|nr:hypothetical protein [Vibrio sinaloensis]